MVREEKENADQQARAAILKALLAQPGDLVLSEEEKYGLYLMFTDALPTNSNRQSNMNV